MRFEFSTRKNDYVDQIVRTFFLNPLVPGFCPSYGVVDTAFTVKLIVVSILWNLKKAITIRLKILDSESIEQLDWRKRFVFM